MNVPAARAAQSVSPSALDFHSRIAPAPGPRAPDALPPLPPRFRLTPEFRLLLAACTSLPVPDDGIEAEEIVSRSTTALDWDVFLALVDRHAVPGPVYAALGRIGSSHLPTRVREKLKRKKIHASGRALVHAAEFVRLSQVLAGAGIEVLPLKGVALSLRLFGDPGVRLVRDLDLMVRPGDLAASDRLLRASGYQCVFPDFALTPKMENRILLQDHHRNYWHPGFQVMLELHWRLDHWTPENVAELWRRSHLVEWKGTTFRQLDDDVLLLFLCSPGAGHKWSQLSREHPCLAAPLAKFVQSEKTASDLASQALRVILMDTPDLVTSERLGQLRYLRYMLRLRRRLSIRAYMRTVWISSSYFKDFSPPDRFFWLHYLLRPLLWLKRYAAH